MSSVVPDHTAVRTALWRARHLEVDAAPPIVEDTVGLLLADPQPDWRERPDMEPEATRAARAGMAARARFVDDLVTEQVTAGVAQYVVLGAGLDTFALRHPGLDALIFEVDQVQTSQWKRRRLSELGLSAPAALRFVPADFETEGAWWEGLLAAGFDPQRPAVVSSTGVSLYLTREANRTTLSCLATLAAGSTVAMTFLRPSELLDETDRHFHELSAAGAAAAGTPFQSCFSPGDIVALARAAGFGTAHVVGAAELNRRYFDGREDGLRASTAEEFLLASP